MEIDSKDVEWIFQEELYHFMSLNVDVDKAKKIIQEKPRKSIMCNIESLANLVKRPVKNSDGSISMLMGHYIEWAKIDNNEIDISLPLILIYIKDDPWFIDGWHRIAAALEKNISELPTFVLTKQESKKVIIKPTYRT